MGRWEEVDEKVLRAVFELKEEALAAGAGVMTSVDERDIAARSGIRGGQLMDSLGKLSSDRLIEAVEVGFESVVPLGVTASGLRALEEWPSAETITAILPDLLRALADRVGEGKPRKSLLKAAEATSKLSAQTVATAMEEVARLPG